MAPSTSVPTTQHRAPVACLQCRSAKVRCLISRSTEQCDRCYANDTTCVFTQPKRAKNAVKRPARRSRRSQVEASPRFPLVHENFQAHDQSPDSGDTSLAVEQHGQAHSLPPTPLSPRGTSRSNNHGSGQNTYSSQGHDALQHATNDLESNDDPSPPVTESMRRRIAATLATLNGRRGAPFSFITPGHRASTSSTVTGLAHARGSQSSLKLSYLLRPLHMYSASRRQSQGVAQSVTAPVKMPTYSASVSLCHTIKDPIEGGLITKEGSEALFQFFMQELNAKWEYILDPFVDTHDDIRRRSPFLLAAVLFCASKFIGFANGCLTDVTDAFIQCRLCSLARSLAIDTFAQGDRSAEGIQALYLLVCWKDADDDISYLHSGYGIQLLHDMDLDQVEGDERRARAMRAYIAMFRQDKQQSLFFMRRSSFSSGNSPEVSMMRRWLKSTHTTGLDTISCCSADIKRIQTKMREMASTSSPQILPCLQDLLQNELHSWRSAWHHDLQLAASPQQSQQTASMYPDNAHVMRVLGLWESSVKLGVATEILRRSLLDTLATSTTLDVLSVGNILTADTPGFMSSVEGALDTLRYLLQFPNADLRRSPDSFLLLGPHASLYLVVVLGCPANGFIGPSFQKIAIDMIEKVAGHFAASILSSQDTISLHSAYLDSLVNLLRPQDTPQHVPRVDAELMAGHSNDEAERTDSNMDPTAVQAPHVLANGIGSHGPNWEATSSWIPSMEDESMPNLELQSLANLVETNAFWEQWVAPGDISLM